MVMKLLKTQTENMLLVERLMYTTRYSLILEKNRCVGCEICQVVCPKEAIEIARPIKAEGEALKQPTITIDENKCHFCGICSAICPFGAVSLRVNGEEVVPVLEKETFPHLVRQIEVEETKCPIDCDECEEACPFGLIKVTRDKAESRVEVEIDTEHCPCCRLCEVKCPHDAITVRKIILGSLRISNERCPEGCHDCVDVCPVPDVLCVSDDGKVSADDFCCVYCGVCRVVCPVEEALQLNRSSIYHTPVHSGAWNKALEKLTSTKEMAKELRTKLVMKARESVKRRFE
jgi:4Fe-4S ferredoxin